MQGSAIFCGLVRNGGDALPRSLARLAAISEKFGASKFVIVTNDNDDDTGAHLADFARSRPHVDIITVNGLAAAYPQRIDRICAARNIYLAEIQNDLQSGDWDVVVVADLDGPNDTLDPDWFDGLDTLGFDWDALFANQRQCYYDLYALRHDQWCPIDCWQEVEAALPRPRSGVPALFDRLRGKPTGGGGLRKQLVREIVLSRQYHIPPETPPIAVRSAFGGLGIYRAGALSGHFYGARLPDDTVVCEHVSLNRAIHEDGGKLFIMPNLLNDAPPEHMRAGVSGAPYPGF